MANRIRGNVVIIDTNGLVNFPGSGRHAKVSSIAFWAADSTGALQMSFQDNSADTIISMASPVNLPNMTTLRFSQGTYIDSLFVRTIIQGTGFLYMI